MLHKTFDGYDLFKDRWKLVSSAESDQRTNELEDLIFEAGEHWDPQVKADRERDGKPCLTIDLISGPIKQVTNQQRTARPGITISPVGGGDTKKAEVWQGLLRRMERLSQADRRAYPWAGQYQVKMGRGFWVIRNQYVGDSDEQDIRIEEVDNQHTVYVDPTCKKLDGSDKKWAIRFEDLTHEEYKARFGDSKLADVIGTPFSGIGDAMPDWLTTKAVRIAEYYYLKSTTRTKVFFDDAREAAEGVEPMEHGYDDELERGPATRVNGKFAKGDYKLPQGVTVRRSRPVTTNEVRWCLINGLGEELDSARIPGQYIPVVKIYGERRNINGKVDERGMVRMAKDASRMEDFCESSLMEAISDAKTAPWRAEFTQLEGLEGVWAGKTPKVLVYHGTAVNGVLHPPPEKVSSGVDVSAITLAAQRMENHVRGAVSQPDTFQDETGSLQSKLSGVAIEKRRRIQDLGTSDYMEGLGDGIVLTAKIAISMGLEVWDSPRIMRILDKANKERPIIIHQGVDQQDAARQLANKHGVGDDDIFDLGDEDPESYDIAIAPGKNFDTQRQETVETLGSLIPNLPPQMQMKAIPILIKNMDGPGMQELAAALEPDDKHGIPPQVQQQLQEQMGIIRQLQDALKTDQIKAERDVEMERVKQSASVDAERIKADLARELQMMKDAAAIEIAKINALTKGVLLDRQAALEAQATGQQQTHDAAQAAADRYHDLQTARVSGQQQAQMADQQHQQALEQGEQGQAHALEAQQQAADLAPEPVQGAGA